MRKPKLFLLPLPVVVLLIFPASVRSGPKKPKLPWVRSVYITGHNTGQVEWAYKDFSQNKGSCLRPVPTPAEADAILQIEPSFPENEQPADYSAPTWVTCTGSATSTHCLDSSGYAMDTECSTDGRGGISCTSTYGPSAGAMVAKAIFDALRDSARRSVVDVYLYTKDGQKVLWSDPRASTTMHTWADTLNKAVGCVQQKCPITHFRPCDTQWYDPSQLGPDGKLRKGK